MSDYNPKSTDAMFATILERLDEIAEDQRDTREKVATLEREKWLQRGMVAAVGVVISAVWSWVTRK